MLAYLKEPRVGRILVARRCQNDRSYFTWLRHAVISRVDEAVLSRIRVGTDN